ncbi:MAG: DUF167 domain-containing protein [Nitrospina sp.]|jgi:hypothetical protein|nr:DUF167 domain-containing protein [Nitrospina sp.]MBT6717646.1 DUF167 domain-containing protein [Nitrospina sp.]
MRINPCENGIRFSAIIQPRSSKNEVAGIYNEALKIRLTSPPVDGAANKACMRFVAKWLEISPSEVSIIKGLSSKNKTIEVTGLTEKKFHEILKNKNLYTE